MIQRILFLLLFISSLGYASVSEVTSAECAAASNTCTMGTTTAGQLLYVYAYNSGAATAPTLPAGWTSIANSTGNTNAERVGCKVAAGSDTTGTWTNATEVIVLVFSGTAVGRTQNCAAAISRAGAAGGASSATIAYNTFTLADTTGTSFVVGCAGHRSATNLTAPSGMTLQQTAGTGPMAICSRTTSAVSSWSTTTTGVNATLGWRSETVEILAPCATSPCFDVYIDMNTGAAGDDLSTTNLGAGTFFGLSNLNATPWIAPGTAGIMKIQAHTAGVRELGGNFTGKDGTTIVGSAHTSKPIEYHSTTANVQAEATPTQGAHQIVLVMGWVTVNVSSGGTSLWDLVRADTTISGSQTIMQLSQPSNKCGANTGIDMETDPGGVTNNSACLNITVPKTVWFNLYYDSTGTTTSDGAGKLALYDTCANGGGQLLNVSHTTGNDTTGINGIKIGNVEVGTDASFNYFENIFFMFDRNALAFPIGPNCATFVGQPSVFVIH